MDPLTLILSALTAGITASVKDTASAAVKDAYNGLKTLIQRKFADQPKAQTALIEYEEDPDTYEKPLKKALSTHQLDQDEQIIAAARHLMTLVQPQQAGMGKYTIQNTGTIQGQIIGDEANVTMHFGETPTA
jgi:thioredoxin-like negative regulator of GroEL